MKQFYFFIGTRAELIKLFPLIRRMQESKINFTIISSGQNNLREDKIFKNLSLQKNTIVLSEKKVKKTPLGLLSWWFETFFRGIKILNKSEFVSERNKVLIIHGDTISTVMGAVFGKIFKAKIAHIEAGLRSFNLLSPFPEEIDRIITSNLADIHFCPNDWACKNLSHKRGIVVNTRYNTLIDSLHLIVNKKIDSEIISKLKNKNFFIFVLHRQENLANLKFVKKILNMVEKQTVADKKCLFILHDNTNFVLQENNLLSLLKRNKNMLIVNRLEYAELMRLMKMAQFIITDGGSNQEECYYLGKPCCLLRTQTERTEGLNSNVLLSKNSFTEIENFIYDFSKWEGKTITNFSSPSELILEKLKSY